MYKTSSEIRNEAISSVKEIYIRYTQVEKEIRTEITLSMTVNDLKHKIVRLFDLPDNFLDGHKLRVKTPGMRNGKVLKDDNKTLEYYHIKNESLVLFSKDKNHGGNYKYF